MDIEERRQLSRRLFAMLSARLEHAAALAAKGEGNATDTAGAVMLANDLHAAGSDVAIISDAICAIHAPID